MNLGMKSETLEFKKSISELEKGVVSLSAMLNKQKVMIYHIQHLINIILDHLIKIRN